MVNSPRRRCLIYLADATRANARFAWIANPNQPDVGLDAQFLALDGPHTDRVLTFGSPTLSLLIGQTCRAVLAEDAVTLTPPSRDHAAVLTVDTRFDTPGPISLAFCGENRGSLRVEMALPSNNVVAGLSQMDVGIRLFYRDPLADNSNSARFLSSLRYPVFSEKRTDWRGVRSLNLTLTIDPLAPTSVERSFFAFFDPANPADAPALPSCFRTNLGHTVYLTPVDAHSRLVFAPLPADSTGTRPGHYLVPAGSFAVSVPRQGNAAHEDNLLCRTLRLEYIKLPTDRPTHLTFVPGQPPYATGFIPGSPTVDPVAGTSLSPLATTAWISVSHPSGPSPVYYTQPDSTVLHAVDGSTRSLDTTFLRILRSPRLVLGTTTLPSFPPCPSPG
ncbi:MAG: hypothetical protein R2873_35310 [Caldilineaceae bacterium]